MSGAAEGLGKWHGMAGEINYPGIKLRCTGQSAVIGSFTIKIGYTQKTHIVQWTKGSKRIIYNKNWQYTKIHLVQCHSSWYPK